MLGIEDIGVYIPNTRVSNYKNIDKFGIDESFIDNKIGVKKYALKSDQEDTSDMCLSAFEQLSQKRVLERSDIDCCVVVTQNPDYNIPHTSAIVHGKLGLGKECACFDISLGCSGYVYGLSIIKSFMEQNGLKKGLLFTADPYSKIVDREDKNTSLLFGDSATVTLIGGQPLFQIKESVFGTYGAEYSELINENNKLHMNGRAIFNFSAKNVPVSINQLLDKVGITMESIDKVILHQGSKYIIDTIRKRLKLDEDKVPFSIYEYGNTVSSSIPNILKDEINKLDNNSIILSGFGVGLSWGSMLIQKSKSKR